MSDIKDLLEAAQREAAPPELKDKWNMLVVNYNKALDRAFKQIKKEHSLRAQGDALDNLTTLADRLGQLDSEIADPKKNRKLLMSQMDLIDKKIKAIK